MALRRYIERSKSLWRSMSRREQWLTACLAVVMVVSGVWSVVGYVSRNTELVPEVGGVYTEAAVGQPRHINPLLTASDFDNDITRLVYSSLFALDRDLNIQNDLATGYELSEDNKTYTVSLRTDVTWHDGERFDADDVVFTVRSIKVPEYGSPLRANFEGVEVNKVDDFTVAFTLQEPYSPFLAILTVGIVPQHVWENIEPQNATLAEQILKPVGTGPYQFSEFTTRRKTGEITEYKLVRNVGYYGQRPYLEEVIFNFFNTEEEAVEALTGGAVDGVSFLPLPLHDRVKGHLGFDMHQVRLPQYFAVFFNQAKNEALADAVVRNALALATNREDLVKEALDGEGEVLQLPIPPGVFAFNEELRTPSFNVETATQNLEEAGWKDEDGDGIREKGEVKLALKLTTTDREEHVKTAELLQKQWGDIGVEVTIESFGAGTIQQTVIGPREYEALFFGHILPPLPDPYPFWHSRQVEQGLNFALFADEEVDKLLAEARTTHDEEKRRELYEQFQGKILENHPAIILYRSHYLFATKRDVQGVNANFAATTAGRFNNIEEWYMRTKRVWK